eukprot:scaffold82903_cov67-Phaeocystis_antarctica.AAC.3
MALALSVEGSTGVPRPTRTRHMAFLSACIGTCSPLVHVEPVLSACGCGGFLRPLSWSACIYIAVGSFSTAEPVCIGSCLIRPSTSLCKRQQQSRPLGSHDKTAEIALHAAHRERPSDIRHPTKLIRVRKACTASASAGALQGASAVAGLPGDGHDGEGAYPRRDHKVEKAWLTTLAPHFYMLEERPAKRGALSTPFLEGIKQQQRHEEPQAVAAEQGGDANEAATPPRE